MNRRDFIRLSLGAAGAAAMPSIAMAQNPHGPGVALVGLAAPLRMGVASLLPVNGLLSIGGAPKVGKSLLAMDTACLLAGSGGWLLERFPVLAPDPVFYCCHQMTGSTIFHRYKTISTSRMWTQEADPPVYVSYARMDLSSPATRAELSTHIHNFGAKYLILDPIEDFGGVKALEGIERDFAKRLSGIVYTYNTPIRVCHHPMGSSIFGDWANSRINMRKEYDKDNKKVIRFEFETRDIPDPEPMTMRLNGQMLRFMPV